MNYQNHTLISDALLQYFSSGNLPCNGGYSDKWFFIKFGFVKIRLPNLQCRIKAVQYHDIHHVLTEYQTTLIGEAEIGAWELATGCKNYWAAWALNLSAATIGLLLSPSRVLRAFSRGRKSRNSYGINYNRLLTNTVGQLRQELGICVHPA